MDIEAIRADAAEAEYDRVKAELTRVNAVNAVLVEALITALPYVESEENNEAYKRGAVSGVVAKMRAALKLAGE